MNARLGFTAFLLLFAMTLTLSALTLSPLAKLMPLVALCPVLIALSLQLRFDFNRNAEPVRHDYPRELLAFSVVAGLALSTALLGVAAAIALLLIFCMHRIAGWSLAAAIATGIAALVLVDQGAGFLGIFLPAGLVPGLLSGRY